MAESPPPGRLASLVRVALGVLFLAASGWKLGDLGGFRETIGGFGIVLDPWVPATALAVIAAEVVVGFALLLALPLALPAAIGLLLLFLGVLAYGLFLGLDVDCGCLGPGEHVSLAQALRRDLVLLALCGYLYWRRRRNRTEGRA